jgi:putative RNA 2'-phosphotransferase
MSDYIKIGKRMSFLLRHRPEDLVMDKSGYVFVSDLINKLGISTYDLDFIVQTDDKKRYSYNTDKTKIRASQGHTIDIDIKYKKYTPPEFLYHGTSEDNYNKIVKSKNINKMRRQHVHLSEFVEDAYIVGKRHEKYKMPTILKIDSYKMYSDGFIFYKSDNNVWLTDNVPLKYVIKK